jgi:hypothetical protein
MGIFKVCEQSIKTDNGLKSRWKIFMCPDSGELVDDYHYYFYADQIISDPSVVKSESTSDISNHPVVFSYSCSDLRINEDQGKTVVIFQ